MLRQSNWRSRNLVMAGNFNMTNVDELFGKLVSLGQHPKEKVDTVTVMEKIGHFLDEENQRVLDRFKGIYENPTLSLQRDQITCNTHLCFLNSYRISIYGGISS
jgi:amidophosphoribosyltransferase